MIDLASNDTLMQYFEWYLSSDSTLWNKVTEEAKHLENIGITHLWLPPAYKGAGGKNDVGYAVYDLYDLEKYTGYDIDELIEYVSRKGYGR